MSDFRDDRRSPIAGSSSYPLRSMVHRRRGDQSGPGPETEAQWLRQNCR